MDNRSSGEKELGNSVQWVGLDYHMCMNLCLYNIVLIKSVFAKGSEDQGSIPGRVIPKTKKIVFDVALLNTQHYKVWVKGKVEQSRERSSALPFTFV